MSDLLAPLTPDGRRALHNARGLAKKHKQKTITPDHLLLGLLQLSGSQAETVLEQLRLNLPNLKARLEAYLKLGAGQTQPEVEVGYTKGRLKLSLDATAVLQEAAAEAQENNLDFLDTRLLVLGILRQGENSAADLLYQYGLTLETFRAQAHLQDQPPVDRPRFERPQFSWKRVPLQISPVFISLIGLAALSGYLVYAGIGNPGGLVFLFVTCGWIASVALHEFGHALVAFWGGDESVAYKGYLTLNPFKYTHPLLSIIFPIFFLIAGGIGLPGGAVYINPAALKNNTLRSLVSAAGPIATVLCALICALPFFFLWDNVEVIFGHIEFWAGLALLLFLEITAIFLNLLPIPGLDGFGIVEPFLPDEIRRRVSGLRPFSFLILYGVLFLDTPLRTGFWDGIWQLIFWFHPNLAGLVGTGFDLFRFWAS